MIWAILAFLGVPLWLCAIGIFMLFFQNRKLRKRPGNMPVRVLPQGKKRWKRGHGIWVSDVFAWRGSPAAWAEDLVHVLDVSVRPADSTEREKLHRLGDNAVVATLSVAGGPTLKVAAPLEYRAALAGPFVRAPEAA